MARFIEFKFSDQHAICLDSRVRELRVVLYKPSFEEEEEGAEGNQRWFGRTRGSAILLWIPSVLIFSVLDRR